MNLIYKALNRLAMIFLHPETIRPWAMWHINHILHRRPSSFPFISGDSFRALADHVWEEGNETVLSSSVKQGQVIFCESHLLDSLKLEILDRVHVPVTLILGNSDFNHSQNLEKIIQNTTVRTIFAQNLVEDIPGVEVLPIGLENAYFSRNGRVKDFKHQLTHYPDCIRRVNRIMWTFTVGTNSRERTVASDHLKKCTYADELGTVTPREHREHLSRYAFVASPPGNGLDTHRTWEAMYLGCIPIVIRSHMTSRFEALGLPVWVLDTYDDLEDITADQLSQKGCELSRKYSSEALWMPFWIERIVNS